MTKSTSFFLLAIITVVIAALSGVFDAYLTFTLNPLVFGLVPLFLLPLILVFVLGKLKYEKKLRIAAVILFLLVYLLGFLFVVFSVPIP